MREHKGKLKGQETLARGIPRQVDYSLTSETKPADKADQCIQVPLKIAHPPQRSAQSSTFSRHDNQVSLSELELNMPWRLP